MKMHLYLALPLLVNKQICLSLCLNWVFSVIKLLLVAMAWQMFLLSHLIPNFSYLPILKRDENGSVNMCLKCDSNTRFRFSPSKLTWATIMRLPNWSILNQIAKLNFKYTFSNQLPREHVEHQWETTEFDLHNSCYGLVLKKLFAAGTA